MIDEWDRNLTRLAYRAAALILEMIAANGRHDGRRLEDSATPVVGELFVLRLKATIRAAGGRHGADHLLRDVQEISPTISDGLECLAAGRKVPDTDARDWLRQNNDRLEHAYVAARLAHMAGTAMKMNAVENFAELRQMAGRPDLRDFKGTSEDIAICLLPAKAREAGRRPPAP